MSDGSASGGISCVVDIIVAIIVIAILVFVCKYIWIGATWAFSQYVDLLRVN